MKRGALTLCAFLLAASVAACAGDSAESSPTATLADPPTTTTLSVEAEVEAAYLRSWDVYAEAMRTFDTSELDDAFVDEALALRRQEVSELRAANTPAEMKVAHNITRVRVLEDGSAVVRDRFRNHSVLVDVETGEPLEPDPDNTVDHEYLMRSVGGVWKVSLVIEH